MSRHRLTLARDLRDPLFLPEARQILATSLFALLTVGDSVYLSLTRLIMSRPGPDNNHVSDAPHARDFEDRIGKTHFLGIRAPPGFIWKARGNGMS